MTASQNVALVTGGSRGIGRAVVEALLERGWKVHFCGRAVDVGEQDQVDAFVADVLDEDGRVDCLVNNAGIVLFAPVDEITGWAALLQR